MSETPDLLAALQASINAAKTRSQPAPASGPLEVPEVLHELGVDPMANTRLLPVAPPSGITTLVHGEQDHERSGDHESKAEGEDGERDQHDPEHSVLGTLLGRRPLQADEVRVSRMGGVDPGHRAGWQSVSAHGPEGLTSRPGRAGKVGASSAAVITEEGDFG